MLKFPRAFLVRRGGKYGVKIADEECNWLANRLCFGILYCNVAVVMCMLVTVRVYAYMRLLAMVW